MEKTRHVNQSSVGNGSGIDPGPGRALLHRLGKQFNHDKSHAQTLWLKKPVSATSWKQLRCGVTTISNSSPLLLFSNVLQCLLWAANRKQKIKMLSGELPQKSHLQGLTWSGGGLERNLEGHNEKGQFSNKHDRLYLMCICWAPHNVEHLYTYYATFNNKYYYFHFKTS